MNPEATTGVEMRRAESAPADIRNVEKGTKMTGSILFTKRVGSTDSYFGFIAPDGYKRPGNDVFVNNNCGISLSTAQQGQKVSFELDFDSRGPIAKNLQYAKQA